MCVSIDGMVVLHIERGATLMRLLRQHSFRSQGQLAHHIEIPNARACRQQRTGTGRVVTYLQPVLGNDVQVLKRTVADLRKDYAPLLLRSGRQIARLVRVEDTDLLRYSAQHRAPNITCCVIVRTCGRWINDKDQKYRNIHRVETKGKKDASYQNYPKLP